MEAESLGPRPAPGSAAAPFRADGWMEGTRMPGRLSPGSSQPLALTKGRCHLHELGSVVGRMWFLKLQVQRCQGDLPALSITGPQEAPLHPDTSPGMWVP